MIGKKKTSTTKAGAPVLTPAQGAAGLIVVAARKHGRSTEVDRQSASAALMKLFHLPGPKASALRAEAEASGADEAGFAAAAAALPPDDKEQLIACLWALRDGGPDDAPGTVMDAVAEAFGMTPARVAAFRPRS